MSAPASDRINWPAWRPISTAPKDGTVILLYGPLDVDNAPGSAEDNIRAVGYWDAIDEAWSLSDATWEGPFMRPTHWMPCPPAPGTVKADRIIVCGGRAYDNYERVCEVLNALHDEASFSTLYHGNARGADTLAEAWARSVRTTRRVSWVAVRAEWSKYGDAAGPLRNAQMLTKLRPGRDLVIAFPGGRGTADMVRQAREAGVEVREIAP